MEPRFKVGDKVRVIHRTEDESRYRCGFVDGMAALAGQIYTVKNVYRGGKAHDDRLPDDGYNYNIDDIHWTWVSSMLELVEETPSPSKEEPKVLDFTPKKKHYQLNFSV
jgi:hypothetical protein